MARSKDEPGKGGFWRLDPEYAESLVDGVFKKRRNTQRPSVSTHQISAQGGTITGPPTSKKCKKDVNNKGKGASSNGASASVSVAAVTARSKAIAAAISSAKAGNNSPPPTGVSNGNVRVVQRQMESELGLVTPQESQPSYAETREAVASIVEPSFGDSYESVPRVIVERVLQLDPLGPLSCQTGVQNQHHEVESESCDIGEAFRGDLCWNSILTDTELDLESFEKYRDTFASGYNGPEAVNPSNSDVQSSHMDFFPASEVGCADLSGDFGLASNVSIDVVSELVNVGETGNASSANVLNQAGGEEVGEVNAVSSSQADWWACFNQPGINDFLCLSQTLLNMPAAIITGSDDVTAGVSFGSDAASAGADNARVTPTSDVASLTSLTAADTVFNGVVNFDPDASESRDPRPWAECKAALQAAALEAAALELESLAELQPSNYIE